MKHCANRRILAVIAALMLLGLGAANLWSQSYTPLYSPSSSNNITWECDDVYGYPVAGASESFTNTTYSYTNSHLHGAGTEKTSTTTPSSGTTNMYGQVTVAIGTTLVGQEEYQTATCTKDGYKAVGTYNFAVGYGDVYYADVPSVWIKIGGSDTGGGTNHGTTAYNRYMTSDAGTLLYYSTLDYLAANPPVTHICTNDMALYVGGKFDICNASSGAGSCTTKGILNPWGSPHSQHDRGTAGDVAGTSSAQCTNSGGTGVNVANFISYCAYYAGTSAWSFNETNHAHCGFSNPSTWPH